MHSISHFLAFDDNISIQTNKDMKIKLQTHEHSKEISALYSVNSHLFRQRFVRKPLKQVLVTRGI